VKTSMRILVVWAVSITAILSTAVAVADPLPGQVLKFAQEPQIEDWFVTGWTQMGPEAWAAMMQPYYGHDELSTAWWNNDTQQLEGMFMADDFADRYDTPVVHVEWWGSYLNNAQGMPQWGNAGVQNFLIAFEADVPDGPTNPLGFSHPGRVLSSQVVRRYYDSDELVAPGTFVEKIVELSNPDEPVFHYNAELEIPFDQEPGTVYWLKIVALNDEEAEGHIEWGWHNRNYLLENAAAANDPPLPGEYIAGKIIEKDPFGNPFNEWEVWHFQDDAVSGNVKISADIEPFELIVDQDESSFENTYYSDADGPWWLYEPDPAYGDSPVPSKDLAFKLYTIPEPSAMVLIVLGVGYLCVTRWLKRSVINTRL